MSTLSEDEATTKRKERNMFIFLTVFLAPILSVIIVGVLGFTIWISQILTGPPSS
ncbi:periplasmic nitrate reductase, NapE protein [Thalassotalea sp. LPB0316]|uniref:periplasmic nitrate reductase, NapE protein n=1 Tax=Thalassotalea sp. LPB0316 TaxID=2769490 RepID=UPI001866B66E|nr:periplasmic nitrate reductase, NapE protein [Thalassotalea sp. LPB0316]QOL26966.1 periplasmic nitrate reductase, NapE protein [Thalassotalea sp. LPB0316]